MTTDLLVTDRILTLRAEAGTARLARLLQLARACCSTVSPSRLAGALSAVRRAVTR